MELIVSIFALIISGIAIYFTFSRNRQDLQQPIKINAYEKLIDSISYTEDYISNHML